MTRLAPSRVFVLGALVLLGGGAVAQDAPAPEALLAKACDTCHAQVFGGKSDAVYTRGNRRVSSPQVLIDQVKLWNSSSGAKWSDTQIDAVARYLNEKYYGFKP